MLSAPPAGCLTGSRLAPPTFATFQVGGKRGSSGLPGRYISSPCDNEVGFRPAGSRVVQIASRKASAKVAEESPVSKGQRAG